MRHLTLRLAVAVLTFIVGATAATFWLFHHQSSRYESSDIRINSSSTDEKQTPSEVVSLCQWSYQIEQILPKLYDEYVEIEPDPTIEKLVFLDEEVRRFMSSRPEYYPCGDDAKHWNDKYAKLGLHLDYWNLLDYSGALLIKAHKINPKSKYRKYTLFSTVEPYRGLGEMPNIKAAFQYAREFPDGPFIEDTLSIIADFHKDLFMVLRDNLRDYKYDCFKPYIDGSPYLKQINRAKSMATNHYKKVLALNPSNARAINFLNEIHNGTINSWSFCAD